MISITLPDNSQRSYEQPTSVQAIAESIGAGLAKAALAGKVNGQLVDLSHVVTENAKVQIITSKDPEGLEVIRHSTAHLLAHAAKSLFPSIQITIGPVIEDGFYYDFAFERSFTPDDLTQLETKMHELANQKIPITRHVIARDKAIEIFRGQGEQYKVQIIQDIPPTETLTFYEQGDFMDLCRGPHVPNTSHLKAFKLMKLAGAYWRGDSKNEMLQRVYGTAWADKKQLDDYLYRLEEAEKRDHRKSAKVMDLFHTQEEAPGMIFWHDQGWVIYQAVEQYIRATLRRHGYQEIKTPHLADHSLWERSGHIAMYREEMFITESENRTFAIKPMSCPLHVQVFNHALHSYRDLPLRLAEFGSCHRNEHSGTLHGLMRVRSFVQDDAHIFCTEEQVQSEALQYIQLLLRVYKDFGFEHVTARLSTRPPKRVGDDALWDKAEHALLEALKQSGLEWEEKPGDGAFYGPKIDFPLYDCLGRVWQCGTLQLDYCLPERLGAQYIAEDGSRKTPVMLHRAILGALERFIGVLLEHYAGHLPFWLAPSQVVVLNITDRQAPYVAEVTEKLKNSGVRANFDLRNEKIGFKIREHTLRRVPYLVVTGDREMEQGAVAVRKRDGTDLGAMPLAEFIKLLQAEPNPGTQRIG